MSTSEIQRLFENAGAQTRQGEFDAAIASYEMILSEAPLNSDARHLAHWGIGDIHLNRKNLPEAEAHLMKAIELKSDEANYHYLLGCCYTYADEVEKAIAALETADRQKPDNDTILGQLAWVVGYHVDTEKGIELCKKALTINPDNFSCFRDLCMLYAKELKFAEALVCIEEAQKRQPDNELIERVRQDVEIFRSAYNRLD